MGPVGRRHEYTGGFPQEVSATGGGGFMSPMQRCFSDMVCQPLVTSYVINAYLCSVVVNTFLGLETKTETFAIRSQDRDLDKINSSALESRDHGLEITSLVASITIGDRSLA